MKRVILFTLLLVFLSVVFHWCSQPSNVPNNIQNIDPHYMDPYRPQIHYSRDTGWLSDPNGLYYLDGEWHLMFQGFSNKEGKYLGTNWDHAKSTDLLHWQHLPTVLMADYRQAHLSYYSGCAIVDVNNVSGLAQSNRIPVLAFYTTALGVNHPDYRPDHSTKISVGYSLDNGKTWTYGSNHVFESTQKSERDPSVFWHHKSNKWVMATAGTGFIRFYSSEDLLEWTFESKALPYPSWECPDLSLMKVEETGEEKVVLITSTNGGVPNSTHGTAYHIGNFDGHNFHPEDTTDTKHWLDWGSDFYAGITYSNMPDDRILFQSWFGWPSQINKILSRTSKFSGTMNLIRELSLHTNVDGTYFLKSLPIRKYRELRRDSIIRKDMKIKGREEVRNDIGSHEPLEIILSVEVSKGAIFGIRLKNDFGEDYLFQYDDWQQQCIGDRTKSGTLPGHLSNSYNRISRMPYRANDGKLTLHIFWDVSTFEVFIDQGREAFSQLIYPREPFSKLEFYSHGGSTFIPSLKIYNLQSIWSMKH